MEIELTGTIRGEQVHVRWRDGEVTGSPILVDRLRKLQASGRISLKSFSTAVWGIEMAAAQRLRLRVLDHGVSQRRAS